MVGGKLKTKFQFFSFSFSMKIKECQEIYYFFCECIFFLFTGEEKYVSNVYTIENMDRHKGGIYLCTASNGIGQVASNQMNLHVLCKFFFLNLWKFLVLYSQEQRLLHMATLLSKCTFSLRFELSWTVFGDCLQIALTDGWWFLDQGGFSYCHILPYFLLRCTWHNVPYIWYDLFWENIVSFSRSYQRKLIFMYKFVISVCYKSKFPLCILKKKKNFLSLFPPQFYTTRQKSLFYQWYLLVYTFSFPFLQMT